MKHWLAIDTSFLVKRAFHGAARRDPEAAVITAVLDAQALFREHAATALIWAFDAKPYKRSVVFPGYKVKPLPKHPDQTEAEVLAAEEHLRVLTARLAEEYLPALGYKNVFRFDGYEADDVIAQFCLDAPGDRITIASRDRDLLQLVGPHVALYDPVTRHTMTHSLFCNHYGLHPTEWPEVKAIAGCASDRLPGCAGVGESTAVRYLTGELTGGKRLTDIRAFLKTPEYERNLKLVTLPYGGYVPEVLTPLVDPVQPPGAWRAFCDNLDRPHLGMSPADSQAWRSLD